MAQKDPRQRHRGGVFATPAGREKSWRGAPIVLQGGLQYVQGVGLSEDFVHVSMLAGGKA